MKHMRFIERKSRPSFLGKPLLCCVCVLIVFLSVWLIPRFYSSRMLVRPCQVMPSIAEAGELEVFLLAVIRFELFNANLTAVIFTSPALALVHC